jgi:hypothetical protein
MNKENIMATTLVENVYKGKEDVLFLAYITYGESSTLNDVKEMFALAMVMQRQSKVRGFSSVKALATKYPRFSNADDGGNSRYNEMSKITDIREFNAGMTLAISAAENAKRANPIDYSGGAYFWDGIDILKKTQRNRKAGVKITNAVHNVVGLPDDKLKEVNISKTIKKMVNGKLESKIITNSYTSVYSSVAGHGKACY